MNIIAKRISSKTITKILHIESVYSIWLFILLNRTLDDTLIVSSDALPVKVFAKMPNYIIFSGSTISHWYIRLMARLFRFDFFYWGMSSELMSYKNCELYGHDHIYMSSFFLARDITLIEDGLSNYVVRDKIKNRIKSVLGIEAFGRSRRVKKILLTGISAVPAYLSRKVEIIDIYKEPDDECKLYLKNIFPVDEFKNHNQPVSILLTQPLSEEGLISEDEKIMIYKKIIRDYYREKVSSVLVVKPHPREKTNYTLVLADYDIDVVNSLIPIEVLASVVVVDRVITIYSTAAYTIKKIQPSVIVNFIGTREYPAICDAVGCL